MTDQEQQAALTLCLMAAFADGNKHDQEREHIKRIAATLDADASLNLTAIYQDVLLRRASLADAVSALTSPESRQLAYELAVGVCDADGTQNDNERAFLTELRQKLGLDAAATGDINNQAEALAASPLQPQSTAEPRYASNMSPAEQDKMILNYAILNGALELLPESLATMAILPLQMKLVYRIGKSYGFELDRGHIKDFLATAGVGLTSQYLEQIGTKLIGGLLRKLGGRALGGIGSQATSSAVSFATTYALGQVAKRYYSGGRSLDAAALKETFSTMLSDAKSLQQRYSGDIAEKARNLDARKIVAELTGKQST